MVDASAVPSRVRLVMVLGAVVVGSLAVLTVAALAMFRLGLAPELAAALKANGSRVLLGLAAGGAFGLAAGLRQELGSLPPLRDLQWLASTSAAGGGAVLVSWLVPPGSVARDLFVFLVTAATVGPLVWFLVGRLDRPRRWTNLAALAVMVVALILASVAGGYVRARRDFTAPLTLWLLGDLGRADAGPALVLLALVVALAVAAGRSDRSRWGTWALVASGLGLGATGPLPFVGPFVARALHRLAAGARPITRVSVGALASGAAVVAIDAVPRLLIGGYALPFAVAAGMVALPVFLGWNWARLRTAAGRRARPLELGELALIALVTAYAASLALGLTRVVRTLT
jgi:hypothetical protein